MGETKLNKRGNLLPEEVLKIVIAVICIGFLVFLLVSLYFSITGEQKSKEAEAVIKGKNGIAEEVQRINAGGAYNEQGFLIPNPAGWYLFSFTEDKKPNSCGGINCLCICEDVIYILDWQKRLLNKCDEKGTCATVSNLKEFDKIKIENNGVIVLIKKVNGDIEISRK
jgi:hypothetical protein